MMAPTTTTSAAAAVAVAASPRKMMRFSSPPGKVSLSRRTPPQSSRSSQSLPLHVSMVVVVVVLVGMSFCDLTTQQLYAVCTTAEGFLIEPSLLSKAISKTTTTTTTTASRPPSVSSATTQEKSVLPSPSLPPLFLSQTKNDQTTTNQGRDVTVVDTSRRRGLKSLASSLVTGALVGYNLLDISSSGHPVVASAGEFAPGGTLVDYEVGVTAGNPQASKSRKVDNSNVVFNQDSYFKFGRAQPFIPTGSTEFPKTVPFTRVTQRYETYKKYKDRVQRGIDLVVGLKTYVDESTYGDILDGTAPEYSIRPMGLFANGFLASENTGTTNELLLARWYINEVALDITDIKNAKSQDDARRSYDAAIAALNSYIGLINRCITSKVGEPFTPILPPPPN